MVLIPPPHEPGEAPINIRKIKEDGECHDPQSPNLDENQNDYLAKSRIKLPSIHNNQPRHTPAEVTVKRASIKEADFAFGATYMFYSKTLLSYAVKAASQTGFHKSSKFANILTPCLRQNLAKCLKICIQNDLEDKHRK